MKNDKAMPMSNERAEAVMEAIRKGREFQGAFLSEFKFTETELNEYFAAECKARSDLYRNDTDKREAAINNLTRKHEYALRGCLPKQPTSD